jgi:hypothetical protein
MLFLSDDLSSDYGASRWPKLLQAVFLLSQLILLPLLPLNTSQAKMEKERHLVDLSDVSGIPIRLIYRPEPKIGFLTRELKFAKKHTPIPRLDYITPPSPHGAPR